MTKKNSFSYYGIIGYPVKHTLSPYMHNAAFNKLGIKAVYVPFSVRPELLKEAFIFLKECGISGFNITIPHKSEAMRHIDEVEPVARAIGAVNTVLVKGGKLIGYNTDYTGFLRSLKEELKFIPKSKTVLVMGAGGASRAVSFGLASHGAKNIYIYDVMAERADDLAQRIGKCFLQARVRSISGQEIADCAANSELFVNCTPLGMKKDDPLPVDAAFLHKGLKLYDIAYTPAETKLVKAAKQKGVKACGGIGMLLYQGVEAFEIWTGKKAPVELMRRELVKHLK